MGGEVNLLPGSPLDIFNIKGPFHKESHIGYSHCSAQIYRATLESCPEGKCVQE